MNQQKNDKLRGVVRRHYGKIALSNQTGCGCSSASCCGPSQNLNEISLDLGYSGGDLNAIPEGANLGLGCGNPQAIAALQPGEIVLDLGSGGGFDCFLAASAVGSTGQVIGVDMTPEMITRARKNAENGGYTNVEFRQGTLEKLPVADGVVDVIISNCVINLSPEKEKVFSEAFRVLKAGGRLAISDVVATTELPEEIRKSLAFYVGCIAGASPVTELEAILQRSGFKQIQIRPKDESREFIRSWVPESQVEDYVVSATIEAQKPGV